MSHVSELAAQFNRDGFVIARSLFDGAELDEMREHLDRFVRQVAPTLPPGEAYYEQAAPDVLKSAFRLHEHDAFFDELSRVPRVTNIVAAIFADENIQSRGVSFFAKAARSGSGAPPHQDNVFQWMRPPDGLTATVALDGSTRENGVLCCQRGSHHLGLLPHRPSGLPGFSQTLIEPLDADAYPEVALCMSPGDVAFHHIESVHQSGANRTSHSRHQLAMGYYGPRAQRDEAAFAAYQKQLEALHDGALDQ